MNYLMACLLALSWSITAYAEAPVHSIKITTTLSKTQTVQVIEPVLGRIQDPSDSTISAEIPARIQQVMVDVGSRVHKGDTLAILDSTDMKLAVSAAQAKLATAKAQSDTQDAVVERYQKLFNEKFLSMTMLQQAQTQAVTLKKSVQAATAQLKQAQHNTRRTHIRAPYDGMIQRRMVAAGDYIGVGKPLFQLVGQAELQAILALPETRSRHIHVGLTVHLHLPQDSNIITASISQLSPAIGTHNDALEARIPLPQQQGWHAGGTVIANIITATHANAVIVPEESVILRPAGEVVYVIENDHAKVALVHTGVHRQGYVEITQGLQAGVRIAQTGAAFLTDGAAVSVVKP